ncbi:MAG: methyltransferase domain-containing protein [Anaerolineae bacterium]|nr:methyltransferase domain-containing protein [Anaerolineae bacterium]
MPSGSAPLAAARGEPSYVWRAGQERRLALINRHAPLTGRRVLEVGCGLGMYTAQYRRRFNAEVEAFDVEFARVAQARATTPHALIAAGEAMPYAANTFDVVIANEVIEHVADDRATVAEMVRVCRPGGRIVIFCPNRWYPVEQHGHYWRGQYHFGNTPLINYLPDRWRNRLAPHVRTYTRRSLLCLLAGQPVRIVHYTRIFGGYDNIIARAGAAGRLLRGILYALEKTPLRVLGLSHLLVVEKL